MGIFLIGIVLFAIGFFWYRKDDLSIGAMVSTAFGCLAIVVSLAAGTYHLSANEIEYQNMLERKEAIEYRLEMLDEDTNLMVNGGVYEDLVTYNNDLREYKIYSDNFWFGWFVTDKAAELDYIELPKGVS